MQRAGIEHLLGVRLNEKFLEIDPCIPDHWPGFEVSLRHAGCCYEISVTNPHKLNRGILFASVDGVPLLPGPVRISTRRDTSKCVIFITLGSPQMQ
jgi:cyclic beta-1,2-glucan synthetase